MRRLEPVWTPDDVRTAVAALRALAVESERACPVIDLFTRERIA